jgi:hypothetical protein
MIRELEEGFKYIAPCPKECSPWQGEFRTTQIVERSADRTTLALCNSEPIFTSYTWAIIHPDPGATPNNRKGKLRAFFKNRKVIQSSDETETSPEG